MRIKMQVRACHQALLHENLCVFNRCMHAAAPRFLRISGAMLGEDMPFAFVNGDYLKTADLLHQRAVHARPIACTCFLYCER